MTAKHTAIAEALIEDVLSQRYRVGERLPSERDLATRFEANRGAVREAMKRLEQLGLARIEPGGARVNPLSLASLDVVGYLMARGTLPDAGLIDQILTVFSALTAVAAEGVLRQGSDQDIEALRGAVAPLTRSDTTPLEHQAARFELMQMIMQQSGNLICQLIARTLFEQFAPSMEPLRPYAEAQINFETHAAYARQLDRALADRDVAALRATFEAFANLNRETIMAAFAAATSGSLNNEAALG
ncbi:MAG: GntR family transcriptional regulator [Pseudomonadota bacterium]